MGIPPVFSGKVPEPEPDESDPTEEQIGLVAWYIERLIQGGYDTYWAGKLAAIPNIDYRRANELRSHGCPQPLAEKILA